MNSIIQSASSLPATGAGLDLKITVWSILLGVLAALILFFILTRKSGLEKTQKKPGSLFKFILIMVFFAVAAGAGFYFFSLYQYGQNLAENTSSSSATLLGLKYPVKFPITGTVPASQAVVLSAKSLYATPVDALTTSSLLLAIGFIAAASFKNISTRQRIETDLENAKIAARNVYEDLQVEAEKLAEAKAKEEAILLSVGDGLIALDRGGKIIFMNHSAEKMLGFTSKESMDKQWYEILIREDEKGNPISYKEGAIQAALSAAKTTTTTVTNSFNYIRKDGTKFPVSRTVSPIVLAGKVIGAINIFRDITREKEIDRAKTEFVSLASHQLRTPLTGIGWLIELIMKKEKLTDKGKEYLNDILFSVHRSNALVKLLLDTSRIENGSVGVHPESMELVSFIEQHLGEYRMLCEKKKLSLTFTRHPDKLNVTTDVNLVEYILQNLITNAMDYTPAGGKIEVVLDKKESSVMLQVKDTGIGIPKSEQARLFEKFMRASNAVTTKTDGTGLGLYIAREAARLLGGSISAQSPVFEGRGSTFIVEIPLESSSRAGGAGLAFVKEFDK